MDYKNGYLFYKKKYLELKKELERKAQKGGASNALQPSYLNFGPHDGSVVDSDQELQQQLQGKHQKYLDQMQNNGHSTKLNQTLEQLFDSADNLNDTEEILGL